ncbi:MAG: hypothetical protein A4E56_00414 [Pelotomaculum sp. PtaU1.Bin065]|nr:MAG: hypothetical protein A4E56_00414 [Pelotomaculum sp. PtaU1.Bin065]
MIEYLKNFWRDDTGDGYVTPLLMIIFAMAAGTVVLGAIFIGLKNMAIHQSQQLQNIIP